MQKSLYHQSENTSARLLASYVYDYNSWEFNSPHFHKNFEILLVITGTCEAMYGNQTFLLRAGDAMFVQPFRIHALHVGEASVVRCMTFHEQLILSLMGALEKQSAKVPVFQPDAALWEFILHEMKRNFGTRFKCEESLEFQKKIALKGILYALCAEAIRQIEWTETEKNASEVIVDIVQYISENFKNNITLRDIARQKGYSYYYLSKLFNQHFQITFKSMLNQYRMEYAVTRLLDTDLPISHIAYESGFQNLRSFNLYCREIYHLAPRELRNRERALRMPPKEERPMPTWNPNDPA